MKKTSYFLYVLVLLLPLVFMGKAWADEYPIMRPDGETLVRWQEIYRAAPKAKIKRDISLSLNQAQSLGYSTSMDLLGYINYDPAQRSQGNCGNCWVWAGTGVMEVAHTVQNSISSRISIEFFDSCVNANACLAGNLGEFASNYTGKGFMIPWSNTNASYADGGGSVATSCNSIGSYPRYPINSILPVTISTYGVGQDQAILNIKNILNQNKAVYYGFYLPNSTAWNDFFNFWSNQAETTLWNPDTYCNQSLDSTGGGHAVVILGYNDDDPDPAKHYWLALNSWGTTSFRPQGSFRISQQLNYDCMYTSSSLGNIQALQFQTLDVSFGNVISLSANINSPNGGEKWCSGIQNILWTAADSQQIGTNALSATLYYGTSATGPWTQIASGLACTSGVQASYAWDISTIPEAPYWIRLVISDNIGNSFEDISDNYFNVCCSPASCTPTIYVPDNYQTIQGAIDAASTNSTIIVRDGTYYERINFNGKAVTVRSENGATSTIINGNFGGSVVTFDNSESSKSVLDGFTITNGTGTIYSGRYCGGGIFCKSSSPTITNCTIRNNGTSIGNGTGSGIYCYSSSPRITNCAIYSNVDSLNGGGISCESSSPKITNCVIRANSAYSSGGALYANNNSSPSVINCTISGNTTSWDGAGIYCKGSMVTVSNTILWGNIAPYDSEISNNGTVTVTYSDIKGGWTGTGNINADPKFLNTTAGDLHLLSVSPCVDRATSKNAPSADKDGNARPKGAGYDMGAYELLQSIIVTITTPKGGEVWGGTHDILWTATDTGQGGSGTLTASIYYAPSIGGSWTRIANGVTCTSGTQASFAWNTTLVQDGTYWIWAEVLNSIGSSGVAMSRSSLRIDNTPPAAPTVSSTTHPNQAAWYSNNNPVVRWTASDSSGIGGYSYTLDQVSGTIPDTVSEGTAIATTYKNVHEGTSYFHIRAVDKMGNWGAASHFTINIDMTIPSAPVVSSSTHPNQGTWYKNNAPAFTWTESTSGITSYCYILDQAAATTPHTASGRTTIPATASLSASYTGKTTGIWYFHVQAKHGPGIWGTTAHYTIKVDVTGPVAPIISSSTHPNQALWYSSNNPIFSWHTSDTASGVGGYSYTLNQSSITSPARISQGLVTSAAYSGKGSGVWYFHVRAVDSLGNWGATTHFTVRIDNNGPAAPAVSSTTHPNQAVWYSNNNPVVKWTIPTDSSGIGGYSYTLDQTPGTIPDMVSEGTAVTTTYRNVADGTWYFHVRAIDKTISPNWGDTKHFTINVDTIIPSAPAVSSSTHPDQGTWYNHTAPAFTWTESTSGITSYCYILDQVAATTPSTASGRKTIPATASLSASYTGKATGTWYFHVQAKHGQSIWGTITHYTVRIDATGPVAPIVTSSTHPNKALWYSSNNPIFSWHASDTASGVGGYNYILDQSPVTSPARVNQGLVTSAVYSGKGSGIWYFHVRGVDNIGNWGATTHFMIRTDNNGPAAPAVSSTTHPNQVIWYNNGNPVLRWTTPVDSSGIGGYSYTLDQTPDTIPDTVSEGTAVTTTYRSVADGTWYFHVRAIDKTISPNWGATKHFTINVDTIIPSAPVVSSSTHPDQGTWYSHNAPAFTWTESTSGITSYCYILDQVATTTPRTAIGRTIISAMASLSASYTGKGTGIYYFHIQAKHGANNWGVVTHYTARIDVSGPVAPTVTSSTHPNKTLWYNNNSPIFSWRVSDTASGVGGYSYILDQSPVTSPARINQGLITSAAYGSKGDGIWYFHVRAVDNMGNWGATTHYTAKIDTNTPSVLVVTTTSTGVSNPTFRWLGSDATSGIAGYNHILDNKPDTVPGTNVNLGSATSRSFTGLSSGQYYFHIRAVDRAGIWGDVIHFPYTVN